MSRVTDPDALVKLIDTDFLVDTTSALAKVPTEVPMGFDTLIDADHPKLVHYVQDIVRPRLVEIGAWELIDTPLNNLVVSLGNTKADRTLMLINYTPAQHNNLMSDPFSGKVAVPAEFGVHVPAVFGQGVSQNKVHQAVMLAVLKLIIETEAPLRGRLLWAINNEGRSSHECTDAILDAIGVTPSFGLIQIPTEFAISLGNRGRIDIDVFVHGKVTHSSDPEAGISAIDGAAAVLDRLKGLTWPDQHQLLGGRQAVVYKMRFEPMAPHTIPSFAHLTIDRRLLPGDELDEAIAEVKGVLADMDPFRVEVAPNVYMLPAMVEPTEPGVESLRLAHEQTFGLAPEERYFKGAFDAGGYCRRGIPTVMYGGGGGVWPIGPDFVTIDDAIKEAQVLCRLILDFLA
jgi:acetylornithine deacetylase/succinyl-diaminopimelate desuccinylase-like protein